MLERDRLTCPFHIHNNGLYRPKTKKLMKEFLTAAATVAEHLLHFKTYVTTGLCGYLIDDNIHYKMIRNADATSTSNDKMVLDGETRSLFSFVRTDHKVRGRTGTILQVFCHCSRSNKQMSFSILHKYKSVF